MTGKGNLVVSYAAQRTATGFNSHVWEYSTDGTTWTAAETATITATSFATTTLASINGLNNAANAYLRLTVSGASATSGNNRLDNIQIGAITLPTVLGMSGTGSFCPESGAQTFGMGATEADVSYALKNGATTVETVAGTGSAISFSPVTATGTYTVVGTRTGASATMSGSATINVSPTAAFASATRNAGTSLKVAFTNFTGNVAGATVTAVDVTTLGGKTLTLSGASVAASTWVAIPTDATDGDSFTYTIASAAGCTAIGTVTIHVASVHGPDGTIASVTGSGPYIATMTFHGVLGLHYHVQRATDLSGGGNWATQAEVIADASTGVINYADNDAPSGGAYYRLIYP
ncbi:MAG: hypothetical protein NTZ16_14365 [Verrucomicrobia bacterium]|nr:hypothetical protein [Verrucomicrobiota bacterium]